MARAGFFYYRHVSGAFIAALLALVIVSCRESTVRKADAGREVVASLDDNYLYMDELTGVMSPDLSPADSAAFADKYIRNWISELLLYKNAERNIPDTREIDELVENYRKALIVHSYEQKLLEQKFSSDISEKEIQTFYDDNRNLFVLDEPLIKGMCVKLPSNAKSVSKIRSLYQKTDDASLDELEKLSLANAVRYESFYENWIQLSQIETVLPQTGRSWTSMLHERRNIEVKDDEFVYFLKVTDMVDAGDVEPLEKASPEIRRLLRNSGEVRFIEEMKDELYEKARLRGRIQFYNQDNVD